VLTTGGGELNLGTASGVTVSIGSSNTSGALRNVGGKAIITAPVPIAKPEIAIALLFISFSRFLQY
jgi:hypothetical protein